MSLSLDGPFQSNGSHRSDFDFRISISVHGKTESYSVLSSGGAAYITSAGKTYKLPPSAVKQLGGAGLGAAVLGTATTGTSPSPGPRSGSATTAAANGTNTATGANTATGTTTATTTTPAGAILNALGPDPKRWLVDPRLVGTAQIGGVATTQVHAGVDVKQLVANLSAAVKNAASAGLASATKNHGSIKITPKEKSRVIGAIGAPSIDIWAASSDHTLRKLSLSFRLTPAKLGVQSTGSGPIPIALTIELSDLNQPQQITAPAHAESFGDLHSQLQKLVGHLAIPGTATVPTPRPLRKGRNTGGAPELTLSPYARCISNSGGNAAKMQRCASLSNR